MKAREALLKSVWGAKKVKDLSTGSSLIGILFLWLSSRLKAVKRCHSAQNLDTDKKLRVLQFGRSKLWSCLMRHRCSRAHKELKDEKYIIFGHPIILIWKSIDCVVGMSLWSPGCLPPTVPQPPSIDRQVEQICFFLYMRSCERKGPHGLKRRRGLSASWQRQTQHRRCRLGWQRQWQKVRAAEAGWRRWHADNNWLYHQEAKWWHQQLEDMLPGETWLQLWRFPI